MLFLKNLKLKLKRKKNKNFDLKKKTTNIITIKQ